MSNTTVKIEVHGPTQILPNATVAVQNIYRDDSSWGEEEQQLLTPVPLTEKEQDLAFYIPDEERLHKYVLRLQRCSSAAEVGELVATMCDQENGIDATQAVKGHFIERLVPFLTGLKRGRGIDNLRVQINEALAIHRKANRRKGL